ncbi:MAG: helix-turn-helix transcriptional regulator [Clostridiaceae bacterium]|nr:helix-turn-helix transcriptional regulator [Clostridiaceae bacterium]
MMTMLRKYFETNREIVIITSILCALCFVPMLVAGLTGILNTSQTASREEIARGEDAVTFFAGAFGEQMDILNNQANQLSLNRRLVPQVNTAVGVADDLVAIDELSNVNVSNPLTNITGVYFRRTETVFTSEYKYTLAQYVDVFSNGDLKLAAMMEKMFRTLDARGWAAVNVDAEEGAGAWTALSGGTGSGGRRIVVAVPVIVRGDEGYDAVVFFILTESDIRLYLRDLYNGDAYGFAILDPAGKRVYADHAIFTRYTDEELAQNTGEGYIRTENGLIYRHTDESGATYFVYPEQQTAAALHGKNILLMYFAAAAAALLLLFFGVWRIRRPLEQLVRDLDEPRIPGEKAVPMLERVLNGREDTLRRQETLLMPRILDALLRGGLKDEESRRYFEERTAGAWMNLVAVRIEAGAETFAQNPLPETYDADGTRLRIYACTPTPPCAYLFVCILEHGDLGRAAHMVGDMLWRVRRERVVTASGDATQDATGLLRSCVTAVQRLTQGEEPAALSEEYPAEELKTFYQYIRAGDNRGAQTTLRDIFDSGCMKSGDSSAKYLLYDLAIGYLQLLRQLNCMPAADTVRALLDASAEYADPELCFPAFAASIKAVCAELARTNRDESVKLRRELLEYVDTHITDAELSQQHAADAFGVSIYTLSRLFKDAAGMGFKEYINERRLTLARRLLVTSPDSIGQIAAACGFENATYFAKLFKTTTGLTPSAYRAENAKPAVDEDTE